MWNRPSANDSGVKFHQNRSFHFRETELIAVGYHFRRQRRRRQRRQKVTPMSLLFAKAVATKLPTSTNFNFLLTEDKGNNIWPIYDLSWSQRSIWRMYIVYLYEIFLTRTKCQTKQNMHENAIYIQTWTLFEQQAGH